MAHAVFDGASLERQRLGDHIDRVGEFVDKAEKEQTSAVIDNEAGSLIDPEYNAGRPMTHTQLERLVRVYAPHLRFYDHPRNPTLKFISKIGWHEKSGYSTVLYHRGIMPENTIYSYQTVKVPHPYNNHIDCKDDPEKQLFQEKKVPGPIVRKGWKRVFTELFKLGWLTQEQCERVGGRFGSSRDDQRFAQDMGKA